MAYGEEKPVTSLSAKGGALGATTVVRRLLTEMTHELQGFLIHCLTVVMLMKTVTLALRLQWTLKQVIAESYELSPCFPERLQKQSPTSPRENFVW